MLLAAQKIENLMNVGYAKFLNHMTNKLYGDHYFRGPYGHKKNEKALNF